jgi:hypothetical protein
MVALQALLTMGRKHNQQDLLQAVSESICVICLTESFGRLLAPLPQARVVALHWHNFHVMQHE